MYIPPFAYGATNADIGSDTTLPRPENSPNPDWHRVTDDRMEVELPADAQQPPVPIGVHPLFFPHPPAWGNPHFAQRSPAKRVAETPLNDSTPLKRARREEIAFPQPPFPYDFYRTISASDLPQFPIPLFGMAEDSSINSNNSVPCLPGLYDVQRGCLNTGAETTEQKAGHINSNKAAPAPAKKKNPSEALNPKDCESTHNKITLMVKNFSFPKTKAEGIYALDFDSLRTWMKQSLEATAGITQAEKEAFYCKIGELLSDEITKHQYNFPYLHNGAARIDRVITEQVAAKSFRELIHLGAHDYTKHYVGMQAGIKMSAFYMNEERINASGGSCKSPLVQWTTEELRLKKIKRVFQYSARGMKQYQCLGLPLIAHEFLMNAPGQFRPAALFDVLHYLEQSKIGGSVTKILDLCAGWGDRLVAAMAAAKRFKVVRYVATDPNRDLRPRYQKIFDACSTVLKQEIKEPFEFGCTIYDRPMEDLKEEELNPDGVQSDLMITSPPFFNYEKYKDHGNTQSIVRYPEVDTWLDNFLYRLVDQAKKGVRNGGIIAIHFSTAKYGDRKICDLLKANMETKLKHITDLSYIAKIKKRKTAGYEGEKFFIYQKVEESDADMMNAGN